MIQIFYWQLWWIFHLNSGNQIKALKASKPPTLKDDLVPLVNELLALKQSYKDLTGSEFGGEKEKEKKTGKKVWYYFELILNDGCCC